MQWRPRDTQDFDRTNKGDIMTPTIAWTMFVAGVLALLASAWLLRYTKRLCKEIEELIEIEKENQD